MSVLHRFPGCRTLPVSMRGHVLGYVGEPTKYFTVEGSNLYFELDKDGTPVDPVAYFE